MKVKLFFVGNQLIKHLNQYHSLIEIIITHLKFYHDFKLNRKSPQMYLSNIYLIALRQTIMADNNQLFTAFHKQITTTRLNLKHIKIEIFSI